MKHIFLMSMALACSASAWGQTVPAQTQQAKPDEGKYTASGELRKPSKYSGLPAKGEYEEVQTESAENQARRQVREAHYVAINSVNTALFPVIDDHGKVVHGETETSALMIYDYAGTYSTLPARTSAAIVIGTVISGKAVLTKDHTFVYSDYQIKIDEILKPDATASLSVGGQVVAYRPGGTIHFPSGHVTNFIHLGEGHPNVGSQYLFFLGRPDPEIPEYQMTLFATYELSHGIVYPLDDANNGQFEGMSQTVLLARVRELITASRNGGLNQ